MSFAQTYLERYASGSCADLKPPDPDLFFSVVIPVFNESHLLDCLESLKASHAGGLPAEIILVINHPDGALPDAIEQNRKSQLEVAQWLANETPTKLTVHILSPPAFSKSKAGPGLARRIGMDMAIRRFNQIKRSDGVIVSMDADTLVDKNYFSALENLFKTRRQANTCTVFFEHLRSYGGKIIRDIQAMTEYEIYLRMVKIGLRWAGYPLGIYTLGSAFAVRASAYVKAGGMGVQQSGEDFYFLHKSIQLGGFWENNDARVYPAGRESDRVLFGTGPFIRDYQKQFPQGYKKYSWKAFLDLSEFFKRIAEIAYPTNESEINKLIDTLEDPVLDQLKWKQKLLKALNQSGNARSFTKWIWRELDGLQIIKYLNLHQELFGAQFVVQTSCQLLSELGYTSCPQNLILVLNALRKIERELGVVEVY
ncbi:MAG: glycosyltransferase [Bacteroidota bacterium]|nr:glycosyltransferase [Bacteroidota bacterium]